VGKDEPDPMHKNLDQLMQAIKKQNQTIERLEAQIKSLKPRATEDLKLAKAFSHKKNASK
jgi:prefoldin subunit 5